MRIGGGGSTDINLLQSDAAQFRNQDFVVSNSLAFFRPGNVNPVAAELSHLQLYNPAGSGVVVLVDRIDISSTITQLVNMGINNTELTTLLGAWYNKRFASADGNAVVRRETNATQQGINRYSARVLANTVHVITLLYPVQLAENEGLSITAGTVNTLLYAAFFGREV